MTRADINFKYKDKDGKIKFLYYYQNGDQYPRGLRDFFHVLNWLKNKEEFNPKGFKKWLAKNYKETKSVSFSNEKTGVRVVSNYEPTDIPAKPIVKSFETKDHFTDYGYTFDSVEGTITAYHWAKVLYKGTREEFIKWLTDYKEDL